MLLAAAVVTFFLGLLHSVGGELFVFRHMPSGQRLPLIFGGEARQTLRWTWHVLTIFGWTYSLILVHFANLSVLGGEQRFVVRILSVSLFLCACLGLVGSRGRHIGWAAFLLAAILCWFGSQ